MLMRHSSRIGLKAIVESNGREKLSLVSLLHHESVAFDALMQI